MFEGPTFKHNFRGKNMKILLGLVTYIAVVLTGCGSDDQGTNKAPQTVAAEIATPVAPAAPAPDASSVSPANDSLYVKSGVELPPCTADSEGRLVYQVDERQFKVCQTNEWAAIDLKGEKGEKGDAGAKGEQGIAGIAGATGAPGSDGKIATHISCEGVVGNGVNGDQNLRFVYDVKILSNGDVFAAGALITNGGHSYSGSAYYAAADAGAGEAGYRASYSNAPGYYFVGLDRATGKVFARSVDRVFDAGLGKHVYVVGWENAYNQADLCTTQNF